MKRRYNRGFSLVEMLIYIGLLAAIFIAVVNMLINLTSSYRALEVSKNIDLSAYAALERMTDEIKGADSINTAGSNLATTTNPALALDTYDTNGNPVTLKFYVSNGLLHVSADGADQGALVASSTSIARLAFYSLAASSTQAVRLEMTISAGTSTTYKAEKFYATAVLRGSYKNK